MARLLPQICQSATIIAPPDHRKLHFFAPWSLSKPTERPADYSHDPEPGSWKYASRPCHATTPRSWSSSATRRSSASTLSDGTWSRSSWPSSSTSTPAARRRKAQARRHDRRADLGQHRRRARNRGSEEGLPLHLRDAGQDEPGEDLDATRLRCRGRDLPDRGRARLARVLLLVVGPSGRRDPGRIQA